MDVNKQAKLFIISLCLKYKQYNQWRSIIAAHPEGYLSVFKSSVHVRLLGSQTCLNALGMNIKPPLNYYTFAGTLALLPNPAGREVTSVCDCCIRHTSIVLLMASTQTPSEKLQNKERESSDSAGREELRAEAVGSPY